MNGPRLALLAALVALALPSGASAADLVVKVRNKHVSELGGYRTNGRHGTLRNAVKAWGRPSTRKSAGGGFCRVSWGTMGVKSVFKSGCGDGSRIQSATLHGKRWVTERGLHVGDPTARLKQLYPGAEFTVSYFWLYKAYDAFVQGDAPIVTAQMKGGAVNLFRVQVNGPK
jgi:hypothetical protein